MSKKKRKSLQIAVVHWLDASHSDGWHSLKEAKRRLPKDVHCRTVGFLVKKTKKFVLLGMSYDVNDDWGSDLMTIPRSQIRDMNVLDK